MLSTTWSWVAAYTIANLGGVFWELTVAATETDIELVGSFGVYSDSNANRCICGSRPLSWS